MQIYSSFWNCFTANKDVDTIKTKNKQTNKQKHIKFLVHVVIVNKPRVNSLQVCWFKNRNNNFYVKTKNNGKKRNSDIICNIYCKRNIYIYSLSSFLQPCLLRRQDIGNCFTVVWTLPGIDTRANGVIQCMTLRQDYIAAAIFYTQDRLNFVGMLMIH